MPLLRPLLLTLLALITAIITTGCTAYTAASEENPGGRSVSGGSSHSAVPHSH